MPFLKIETSVPLSDAQTESLLRESSRTVAHILRKPEQYVMVGISLSSMLMSAKGGPAAFCDLRSIGGLSSDACATLSAALCTLLSEKLGIEPDRVYLNFTELDAVCWGWNGTTFG